MTGHVRVMPDDDDVRGPEGTMMIQLNFSHVRLVRSKSAFDHRGQHRQHPELGACGVCGSDGKFHVHCLQGLQ